VNCLAVRDRLAEYALDALAPSEADDVERHLDGCLGCRKESEDLRDGAAVLAFGLPTVAPSDALGARVIGRVVRAKGAVKPHRRSRRAWRVAGAAGLAAALLAAGTLAQAVHTRDMQLRQLEANAAQKSKQIGALTVLIERLRRERALSGTVYGAEFLPVGAGSGSGAAVVVVSRSKPDWVFLQVDIASSSQGPFRALLEQDGETLPAGALTKTPDGGFVFKHGIRYFDADLSNVSAIIIVNGAGKTILVGLLTLAPSPDPQAT
jgi:hypothetical protein